MVDVLRQILNYLVGHYALYMVVTMSAIVSLTIAILAIIKKPIKKLTAKIPNERLRKLANKTFIVLAFAISGATWIILNVIAPSYFSVDAIEVLLTGAFAIVIYALGDGVVTAPVASQLVEKVTDFVDDKQDTKTLPKTENKTDDPVGDFWKKVK